MRNTANILGVPVDKITMRDAVEKVKSYLTEERVHAIYTPNAEIMMAAQRDPELKDILSQADMLTADGAGIILASKILGLGLPEKVSGVDLVKNLFFMAAGKDIKFFFFGSKPGVAETAGENIVKTYGDIRIAGYRNGYFGKEDEIEIINQINASGADILLVALGAPKQEKWIHEHRDVLKPKVCIGVGGTLDIFAGTVKLASEFMRKHGFEWLYRLYREPRRFIRMLDLPRFVLRIIGARLSGK